MKTYNDGWNEAIDLILDQYINPMMNRKRDSILKLKKPTTDMIKLQDTFIIHKLTKNDKTVCSLSIWDVYYTNEWRNVNCQICLNEKIDNGGCE